MRVAAPAQTSLIDLFVSRATEAAAKVERIPRSPAEVRAAIARATQGARTLVVADGDLIPADVFSAARTLPGVILRPTDDQLSTADAGVTEAFAGVARTGSVCITMGPHLRAAASLLMPLHVALLPADRIVLRPRELFEPKGLGEEALRRNLVFVTGPSATADMGPLVRGVHGPHRLHILVLE
jgi:L-lactate dehydrogenase complex protein LldG